MSENIDELLKGIQLKHTTPTGPIATFAKVVSVVAVLLVCALAYLLWSTTASRSELTNQGDVIEDVDAVINEQLLAEGQRSLILQEVEKALALIRAASAPDGCAAEAHAYELLEGTLLVINDNRRIHGEAPEPIPPPPPPCPEPPTTN